MTTDLHRFADIHSHDRDAALRGDTIVNIDPGENMLPGGTYSVGIHPWSTAAGPPTLSQLKALVATARDPRVVAIGEAGFDTVRGGDIAIQQMLFDFHSRLAARLHKPLIIHSVKAQDQLLAAARRLKPGPGQWIIHGFRGKPQQARQLLAHGLALSLGKNFNPATLAIIPPDRLYHESDSSSR